MLLQDAKLPPAPSRLEAVERAWKNLTSNGPVLSATERISVIIATRAAWSGAIRSDSTVLAEAAHWLAADAGGITGVVVDDFETRGLNRFRYLEAVGVVARLANIDFYARGIGASLPEIPEPAPEADAPTGYIADGATITDGWVPATGPLFAPASLDALPAEGEALRAIHEPMYMPMDRMGEADFEDGLTRAQIEFVAARTSYLNECFY